MKRQREGFSALRIVGTLGALLILVAVIGSVVYERVPPSRLAGSALYAASQELRDRVEANARKGSSLAGSGDGMRDLQAEETPHGRVEKSVDPNGVVAVRNTKHRIEIVLSPSIRDNIIDWKCTGIPRADVPVQCR